MARVPRTENKGTEDEMSRINELVEDLVAGRITRRQLIARATALGAASATLSMGLRDAAAQAGNVLVGFSFTSFEHFRWAHDRRYFETRANELGMKYIIQGAEEDVAKQDAQVDAMIAQGIK